MSTAIIKPVKRTSTTESTVETIQELILSGHWMPRQAIPSQKELAAVLGVSRTVVREASEILKQRGLIKIIHGGGMFVATPSLSGLQDALELFVGFSNVSPLELCDMRLLIETELARLAAKNSTQASTSELTRLVRLLDSTVNTPDQHILADLEFHTEIGRLARQSVLSAIVQSLHRPIQQSMYLGMSGQENVTRSDEQHRAIYEAIIAGDETLAAARMREHQLFIRDYVERAIETNG